MAQPEKSALPPACGVSAEMVSPHTMDLTLQIKSSRDHEYHMDLHTRALTNDLHTSLALGAWGCIHLCHSASAEQFKSTHTPFLRGIIVGGFGTV